MGERFTTIYARCGKFQNSKHFGKPQFRVPGPGALYCARCGSCAQCLTGVDFTDVWGAERLERGPSGHTTGKTVTQNPRTIQEQVSFAWENVSRGFMRAVTIFKIWKFSEILNFLLCRPVQTRIQVWTGYPGGRGQQSRHRL